MNYVTRKRVEVEYIVLAMVARSSRSPQCRHYQGQKNRGCEVSRSWSYSRDCVNASLYSALNDRVYQRSHCVYALNLSYRSTRDIRLICFFWTQITLTRTKHRICRGITAYRTWILTPVLIATQYNVYQLAFSRVHIIKTLRYLIHNDFDNPPQTPCSHKLSLEIPTHPCTSYNTYIILSDHSTLPLLPLQSNAPQNKQTSRTDLQKSLCPSSLAYRLE